MINCTQCGYENDETSKFCRSCGAKLDPYVQQTEEQSAQEKGAFSGAEVKTAEPISPEEMKNDYGTGSFQNNSMDSGYHDYYGEQAPQYYYSEEQSKTGGGNIGYAIASLICGILSMICCCLPLFGGVLAVAAIVLGCITLCSKFDGKGMAIAGIITGGIGVLLLIVVLIFNAMNNSGALEDLLNELSYYLDEGY